MPEQVSVDAPALARPRLMTQRWRDVAFLHWAVDPETVARFFPPGVRPDVLDGRSYVGLVPFRMIGAGFGGLETVHRLGGAPVRITIVDRRNHHLFQPLLYQAATASLAPSTWG